MQTDKKDKQEDKKQNKLSVAALYLVAAVAALGAIWLTDVRSQQPLPPANVKQTEIKMNIEDFNDDPRLQKAIQDQLQPQTSPPQPTSQDGSTLQPVPSGIPPTGE